MRLLMPKGEVEGAQKRPIRAAGAHWLPAPAATLPRITDPSSVCWTAAAQISGLLTWVPLAASRLCAQPEPPV